MSNTALYTAFFFVALASLIYGAVLLRIPLGWIVVGGLLANGVGILWASSYTSANDPPAPP